MDDLNDSFCEQNDFNRSFCGIVFVLTNEVVFNLNIFFLGHLFSLHG